MRNRPLLDSLLHFVPATTLGYRFRHTTVILEFACWELACRLARQLYIVINEVERITCHLDLLAVGRIATMKVAIQSIDLFLLRVVEPLVLVAFVSVVHDCLACMNTSRLGVIASSVISTRSMVISPCRRIFLGLVVVTNHVLHRQSLRL